MSLKTPMQRLVERWRAQGQPETQIEENHRNLMAGQAELQRMREQLEADRAARAARVDYAQQLQAAHPYPAGVGQQNFENVYADYSQLLGQVMPAIIRSDFSDTFARAMQVWSNVEPAPKPAPAILPESAPRRFDFTE